MTQGRGPRSNRFPAARRGPLLIPVLAMMLLAGGCGPLKFPELPAPIETPATEVRAVRLIESSQQAGRYQIVVHLSNPNELPLPMVHAGYRLRVGDRAGADNFVPAATVPAEGQMTIELPTALPNGAPQGSYEVSGTVSFRPEGEIRKVLYQLGVPLPTAPFEGSGTVQVVSGAAAEPAEPAAERGNTGSGEASPDAPADDGDDAEPAEPADGADSEGGTDVPDAEGGSEAAGGGSGSEASPSDEP